MKVNTKKALMAYFAALENYAFTRGDGPFFIEDREEAEGNLEIKRKELENE